MEEADECSQEKYWTVRKTELLKWTASLGEQLQKIVLLEQILAELAAYEKVTGQEAADKIE